MNNYLYCFDENYNFQAFSSIISILDKVSKKINIYVIHKNENNNDFFPRIIKDHVNLNKLVVYKFNKDIVNFPNLYDAHVSEATYYRLFCTEYLPENLETVLYIDADIICVSDPTKYIESNSLNLVKNDYVISAKTEVLRTSNTEADFDRLNMKSSKYFNAGVMNINLTHWKNLDINLNQMFEEFQEKLNFWDQDLLNNIFDGDYLELDKRLNHVLDFAYLEYVKDKQNINETISDNLFIHFAGSHKPWSVNGIMCNLSEIYQKEFRKVSTNYFHITHKIRSYSLLVFYRNLINLKFFRIKKKNMFLIDLIKSLLKIKIRKNED